jgi:hypothetical protein
MPHPSHPVPEASRSCVVIERRQPSQGVHLSNSDEHPATKALPPLLCCHLECQDIQLPVWHVPEFRMGARSFVENKLASSHLDATTFEGQPTLVPVYRLFPFPPGLQESIRWVKHIPVDSLPSRHELDDLQLIRIHGQTLPGGTSAETPRSSTNSAHSTRTGCGSVRASPNETRCGSPSPSGTNGAVPRRNTGQTSPAGSGCSSAVPSSQHPTRKPMRPVWHHSWACRDRSRHAPSDAPRSSIRGCWPLGSPESGSRPNCPRSPKPYSEV